MLRREDGQRDAPTSTVSDVDSLCLFDFSEGVDIFCGSWSLRWRGTTISLCLLILLLLLLLVALLDAMTQQRLVFDIESPERLCERRIVLLALARAKLHSFRLERLGLCRRRALFET